jgi:hypothetical protein
MVIRRLFICLHLSLALCAAASAADVRAFVDRNRATSGESIQLIVAVSGAAADVDVRPIQDFKVISTSTSTNVQISNGQTTREVRYIYTLLPLKKGRLTIPRLPVRTGGKTYYTKRIQVQVSGQPSADEDTRDVFVQARVSEPAPFVGQQIIYTFKLSHAVRITNARFQPPEFEGFHAEEIENRKSFRSIISGRQYITTEVTYVLVPISDGEKTIDAAALHCGIVRANQRRRDPFGSVFNDPFFARTQAVPKVFHTKPMTVNVKPLPPYSGAIPFSGLVGKFDIRVDHENTQLKVGDSATLAVTVAGRGNIMDAEAPPIRLPQEFKTYADTPHEEVRLGPKGYSGKKVFRTALVPMSAGEFRLPAIELSYFDVSRAQYITRKTKPVSLAVAPAAASDTLAVYSPPASAAKSLKKKVAFTGRDILPVKEDMDAIDAYRSVSVIGFLLWLAAPGCLFAAVLTTLLLTKRTDDPAGLMIRKSQTALKRAAKTDADQEFFSSLHKAVTAMILSKAGSVSESLTHAEAEQILLSQEFGPETASQAVHLLETIESARYSGNDTDRAGRQQLLTQSREFIRSLSK